MVGRRRRGRRRSCWPRARSVLPELFSDDPEVVALAGFLLLCVAALQPLNGLVFALDGILIGAGDLAFLAKAMVGAFAVFAPAAVAVLFLDLGIGWVWASIAVLFLRPGHGPQLRFAGDGWIRLGADYRTWWSRRRRGASGRSGRPDRPPPRCAR